MMKQFTFFAAFTLLTIPVCAHEVYTVVLGDTLSSIVEKHFPNERIYRREGKLEQIVRLNPQIKNPNKIYPNQVLNLTELVTESPAPESEPETQLPVHDEMKTPTVTRELSYTPGLEEWNLSALYGAKFVSISQTGGLRKINFGVLFLNDLKLQSEFIFENWSAWFLMDTYSFKFESSTGGDEVRMTSLDFGTSYNWLLASFGVNQVPIFKDDAGNVEMARITMMSLSLGAKKDIELPTRKPTKLKLKGWVSYLVSGSSDSSEVEVSSVSGYGIRGQAELNREIYAKSSYSLHATWMMDIGYQKISQDVEWGSKMTLDSKVVDTSTSLGLLLKF